MSMEWEAELHFQQLVTYPLLHFTTGLTLASQAESDGAHNFIGKLHILHVHLLNLSLFQTLSRKSNFLPPGLV
jgi:hypothetical protein